MWRIQLKGLVLGCEVARVEVVSGMAVRQGQLEFFLFGREQNFLFLTLEGGQLFFLFMLGRRGATNSGSARVVKTLATPLTSGMHQSQGVGPRHHEPSGGTG